MRAADKVALVDTVYGADLGTSAAARALRVVYRCKVIHYVDGIVRTGLLALFAGDTAIGAGFSRFRASRVA